MADQPLAHSAPKLGMEPQTYEAHIAGSPCGEGVINGARRRAAAMIRHHRDPVVRQEILAAVGDAATFHDLGKLDPDVQNALRRGRGAKLCWDHIDAGVAHMRACGAHMAAWIVRAHHAPGLPSKPHHFTTAKDRKLRGRRDDRELLERHQRQKDRTDDLLPAMLDAHHATVGRRPPTRNKALHGLPLRLALSCLVDADHSDTAAFDVGWKEPIAPDPRWCERLKSLDAYVSGLSKGDGRRDDERRAFYEACRRSGPDASLVACEGPVGIGKTTAVTAFLLRRAIATGARRLFVVAPYTAILSQTAERLRKALVLDDERDRADAIVAEHHHRADFDDISSRDLATLWSAPVILTTGVQFFETLASNSPSALRKLHSLPGSVVFLDEAHAALPVSGKRLLRSTDKRVETPILAQNWRWLRELARDWSCSFVFASGSLARFWEVDDIVGDARVPKLPDLVPDELVAPLRRTESNRVRYVARGRFDGPGPLAKAVTDEPGPRLLIMNTVQSAAVMARHMAKAGHRVMHLSTALCPLHRELLFALVKARLKRREFTDWTLVATSLMEAGVEVSFRTPFRERFGTTSLIQIGGRGNRNFEWHEGITVHDFRLAYVEGLTEHPDARGAGDVLAALFEEGEFDREVDPAALVTLAMRREMRRKGALLVDHLGSAEEEGRYPDVASLGRVIECDSRLVVVDPELRDRVIARKPVSTRDLLTGSVQIRASKIDSLGLGEPLPGRREIYWWPHAYDAAFLGYMEGALYLKDIADGAAIIVD